MPCRWFLLLKQSLYDCFNGMLRRNALLASVLFFVCSPLWAHALLVRSTPAAGGSVAARTFTVDLKFNSRVDGKRSRISIVMPDGKLYPLTVAAQQSPDGLIAPVTGIAAGAYKLRWQVLAVDGHITRGEFAFEVK